MKTWTCQAPLIFIGIQFDPSFPHLNSELWVVYAFKLFFITQGLVCKYRPQPFHSFLIFLCSPLCSFKLSIYFVVLAWNSRWSKWSLCHSTAKRRNHSAHRGTVNFSWWNSIRGFPWAWTKRIDDKGTYPFSGTHLNQFIAKFWLFEAKLWNLNFNCNGNNSPENGYFILF